MARTNPWIGLLVVMAACSGEKPAANTPTTPVAASAKKPNEETKPAVKLEVPSIFSKPKDDYAYNPVGKRDPFREYKGELIQDVTLPTSPLERFELDQLVLTAIVWGIANPRALVRAPDGQSYIVRSDMRIGKNRGRIARITRRELFVEEEYRDPTGKLVVREAKMEIRARGKPTKKEGDMQLRFEEE